MHPSINHSITPSSVPPYHPNPPSSLHQPQHSPVVPSVEFMANKARAYLKSGVLKGDATRIWINPDCGLKTRRWEEVRAQQRLGQIHRTDNQRGCLSHCPALWSYTRP